MNDLTAPNVVPGVHCSKLRTKRMYIQTVVDPDESRFYDSYETSAYWCAETQTGFGPDRQPVRADTCAGHRGCCEH